MYIDIINGRAAPRVGDFLVAVGKRGRGSVYRVLTCYRVKRRDPKAYPRYQMTTETIDDPGNPPLPDSGFAPRVFEFRWYPRKKKRKTFERHLTDGIARRR